MTEVAELVERKLREAQRDGRPYVMFIHGWSIGTRQNYRTIAGSKLRAVEKRHAVD